MRFKTRDTYKPEMGMVFGTRVPKKGLCDELNCEHHAVANLESQIVLRRVNVTAGLMQTWQLHLWAWLWLPGLLVV